MTIVDLDSAAAESTSQIVLLDTLTHVKYPITLIICIHAATVVIVIVVVVVVVVADIVGRVSRERRRRWHTMKVGDKRPHRSCHVGYGYHVGIRVVDGVEIVRKKNKDEWPSSADSIRRSVISPAAAFCLFHKNDRNDDKTNNHKKQQQHHHCLGFGIGHASFPSSVWLSTFLSKTLTVLPSAVPRCPESAHVKTESTNGLEEPEMSEPVLTAQLQQYMKW